MILENEAKHEGVEEEQRQKRRRTQNRFRFPIPTMSYFDMQMQKLKREFDKICAHAPKEIRDYVWNAIADYDIEEFVCQHSSVMDRLIASWLQNIPHDDRHADAIFSFFANRRHFPLRSPAGIPEFKSGTNFWNAPKHVKNSCLMVDGASLLGEDYLGRKLYVRDCYEQMSQEIADSQRVIITGAPGIGKSTFGLLLSALASMGQGAPVEARRKLVQRWLEEEGATMSDQDTEQLMSMTEMYSEERMVALLTATLREVEAQAASAEHGAEASARRVLTRCHFEAAAGSIKPLRTHLVVQTCRGNSGGTVFYVFVDDHCYKTTQREMDASRPIARALLELVNDPGTMFIVDGRFALENGPDDITCKIIQVTYPNYDHYHGFLTESGPVGVKLRYMPLWDDEEIARCHSICYPDIDKFAIDARAEAVGNVPQLLFNEAKFKLASDHIDHMSEEMVYNLWKLVSHAWAPPHREYARMDHVTAHFQCDKYFQEPTLRFASKKVTEKVASVLVRHRIQVPGFGDQPPITNR